MYIIVTFVAALLFIGTIQCGYIGQDHKDGDDSLAGDVEVLKALVRQQNGRIDTLVKKQVESDNRIYELENQLKNTAIDNMDLKQKLSQTLQCMNAGIKQTFEDLAKLTKFYQTMENSDNQLRVPHAYKSCPGLDGYSKTLTEILMASGNRPETIVHNVSRALDQIQPNKRFVFGAEGNVAFSASLSTFPTGLGNNHPIPFDKVLTNIGNAFDTVTHTFICPVNGIYFFHVSLMSVYHQHIETELVKDNEVLARNYAAGAQTSAAGHGYDQGGNAVLVPCNKGQHVWVRNRGMLGTDVTGDEFSTFLGFLLIGL